MYTKNRYAIILLLIPFLLITSIFIFYPAIVNVYNGAFTFRHKLDENPIFVKFDNIIWLVKDEVFWKSLSNTAILIICVIVFQVGIALVLALLVNNVRAANVFRIIFFMPIVISATAIGIMYLLFIQPEGLFTQLIGKETYNWLPINNIRALFVVMAPVIWQYIGFYFVILLTGLASIPNELNEAAIIDGANKLQTIRYITIPLLWNVLRTCVVLAVTGALKVFDLPHTVAVFGTPGQQTIFMGTYNHFLYSNNRLGQSAVYSVLIVLVGVGVSLFFNKVLKENKDIIL